MPAEQILISCGKGWKIFMGKPSTFSWYGESLESMNDIWEEVVHIVELGDELLAKEFIDDYGTFIESTNECEDGRWVAMQNIGYMAGYYDEDIRQKVYQFFEVEHPIFGTRTPTPEEAFEEGKKLGEAIKNGTEYP